MRVQPNSDSNSASRSHGMLGGRRGVQAADSLTHVHMQEKV